MKRYYNKYKKNIKIEKESTCDTNTTTNRKKTTDSTLPRTRNITSYLTTDTTYTTNRNTSTDKTNQDTTTNQYTTTNQDTQDTQDTTVTYESTSQIPSSDIREIILQDGGRENKFTSIINTDYKKESEQKYFSRDQIVDKITGTTALKTMEEKEIIKYIPVKAFVKYYNTVLKKFRNGGLLFKVDYPKYITLGNTVSNIMWSVQLKDNTLYIKDEVLKLAIEKREKENLKNKLYKLYIQGKLRREDEYESDTDTYTYTTQSFIDETLSALESEEDIKERLYYLYEDGLLKRVE